SFLRDRSPVTPNSTSTLGPAIRGSRRSSVLRNGLGTAPGITGSLTSPSSLVELRSWLVRRTPPRPRPRGAAVLPAGLGAQRAQRPGQFLQARRPVAQVQPDGGTAAFGQRVEVAQRLGQLQPGERVRLAR